MIRGVSGQGHRAGFSAVLAALCLACGAAVSSLGPTPETARVHADELLGALAARFGPAERSPALTALRAKLARAALAPSLVFDDASAWPVREADRRVAYFSGSRSDGRYRLGVGAGAPDPTLLGEYRGFVRLERRRKGEYEWAMREELAAGTVSGADLSRALTALFLAAERTTEPAARAAGRQELPRTSAALGRLFTLDALRLVPSADGATAVSVRATLHPEGLQRDAPRYARFLRKYATPLRVRALATDESGAAWWQAAAQENHLTLELRVKGGDLAPLGRPPRRIPERLRVSVVLTTRMGIFRVGLRGLDADVTLTRAFRERGFVASFRREPRDWVLPFVIEPFLRSSLRRPFQGEGATLAFAIRDGAAGPTLLTRDYRVAVQESWMVRWLAGLMNGAVEEFRREAEEEADRFSGEVLGALQADARELAPRP